MLPTALAALEQPLLEPMEEADLAAVTALEALAQSFPWSRQNFSDSLLSGYDGWVCRLAGQVVGYYMLMRVLDEAHLLNVAVLPVHQGRGLGGRLLRHAMNLAAKLGGGVLFLEVRPSNLRAIDLYRNFGFVEIGRRKAYYPALVGREDALIFSRSLEAQ